MNENQFKEINRKLALIIRLLASQIIHGKEFREQVILLHKIGLQPKDIAEITGKNVNNIRVTLHLIRKGKKTRDEK